MKPQLKTVYVHTSNETKLQVGTIDQADYYKSFDKIGNVKEKELITFTQEEYNQHIQKVIKDTLQTAAEKSKMSVQPSKMEEWKIVPDEITREDVDDEESGCEDFWISVNKDSITDTLEETFNKLKHEN
jgi:hypothetical protein